MADSSDEASPPKKTRRYKQYLDLDSSNRFSEPPRQTVWNIENFEENSDELREKQQQTETVKASTSYSHESTDTIEKQVQSNPKNSSPDQSRDRISPQLDYDYEEVHQSQGPNSSFTYLSDDQSASRKSDLSTSSSGKSSPDESRTQTSPQMDDEYEKAHQPQRLKSSRVRLAFGQSTSRKSDLSSNSSGKSSSDESRASTSLQLNDEYEETHQSQRSKSSRARLACGLSASRKSDLSSSSCGNSLSHESRDQCSAERDAPQSSCAQHSGVSRAANEDNVTHGLSDYVNDDSGRDGDFGCNTENVTHQHNSSNSQSWGSMHASLHAAGGGGHDPNSSPENSSDDESDDDENGNHFSDDGRNDIGDFSDGMNSDDNDEEAWNIPPNDDQQPVPPPPEDQRAQQPPPPPPEDHHLREKLQAEYSGRITDNVAASRAEVLLNIQEFCKQHPLPLTAQEDLHKLINTMFYKEIVPESTYKLDKLYASAIRFHYYFYCFKCFSSFGELPNYKEVRVKKCELCESDNIVYDLTLASFFVIIEFVDQLQLLLKDPKIAEQLKNPNEFPDNGDHMRDLHDGSVYKKFVASLEFGDGLYYISFCASTDGFPLFRLSSKCSIWPIFISINELPVHIRMSNILIGGLWFGNCHPKMDLFLKPLVSYIVKLSDPGFTLNVLDNVRFYRGYLLGMCMDSGARGAVQCVHLHVGESSCNWCLHPGEVEGGGSNARKFIQYELQPAKRTTEQMIRDGLAVLELPGTDNHINGVIGLSPLLRCPKFDIVDGMILDTLHWASFGIARRMVKLWLGETKKKKKKPNMVNEAENNTPLPAYYVGTDATKAVIDLRISRLRPPREGRRLIRKLSLVHEYSAREWENWLLYYSIPLFKNILPDRFLKHWILFVQAYYLKMKSDVTKEEIRVSGILMKMYVDQVFELYGRKELSFNMHISNHAADNALRWGNGWSVSMYAFENGNKCLKGILHAERGIPHQVIRSLQRDSSLNILRAEASTAQSEAFRTNMTRKEVKKSFYAGSVWCLMPKEFTPTEEERWHCQQAGIDFENFVQCTRIISKNICYGRDNRRSRTDNSFCCVDGGFVKIRNIIAEERSGLVYLFVSKVRCTPYPLPNLPRTVTSVNFSPFLFIVDLIEGGTTMISCDSLESKICVFMEVDCRFYKGKFLSVMANTFNVF